MYFTVSFSAALLASTALAAPLHVAPKTLFARQDMSCDGPSGAQGIDQYGGCYTCEQNDDGSFSWQGAQCPSPAEKRSLNIVPVTTRSLVERQDMSCDGPSGAQGVDQYGGCYTCEQNDDGSFSWQGAQCPSAEKRSLEITPLATRNLLARQDMSCDGPSGAQGVDQYGGCYTCEQNDDGSFSWQGAQCPSSEKRSVKITPAKRQLFARQDMSCDGPSGAQGVDQYGGCYTCEQNDDGSFSWQGAQCPSAEKRSVRVTPAKRELSTRQDMSCDGPAGWPGSDDQGGCYTCEPNDDGQTFSWQSTQCPQPAEKRSFIRKVTGPVVTSVAPVKRSPIIKPVVAVTGRR